LEALHDSIPNAEPITTLTYGGISPHWHWLGDFLEETEGWAKRRHLKFSDNNASNVGFRHRSWPILHIHYLRKLAAFVSWQPECMHDAKSADCRLVADFGLRNAEIE